MIKGREERVRKDLSINERKGRVDEKRVSERKREVGGLFSHTAGLQVVQGWCGRDSYNNTNHSCNELIKPHS